MSFPTLRKGSKGQAVTEMQARLIRLGSFFSLIVGFVYSMLALFDVFPEVTQSLVLQLMNQVLTFLGLIGVIVDPTTAGISDSERAMDYVEPWDDNQ